LLDIRKAIISTEILDEINVYTCDDVCNAPIKAGQVKAWRRKLKFTKYVSGK